MTESRRNRIVAGLALVFLVLFCAGGWLRNPSPRLLDLDTNLPEGGEVPVGAEITCQIRLATSWRQRPTGVVRAELPEGVSLAPGTRIRFQTVSWGTVRWHLLLRLRPCRPGTVAGGEVEIPCGKGAADEAAVIDLPSFAVTVPPTDTAELETAPFPEPEPPATGLAWLLVAAVLALGWFWQRRRRQRPLPPGASDHSSLPLRLEELRDRLDTPDASLFASLGDLVAESLEETHGVPARGLTQREQAAWLTRSGALNASLAEQLLRFWHSAEAVRFAGESATPEQAREAFAAARDLVAHRRGGRR